ncbi:MAG TPA: S26 family signal peptidase [Pirellulales bacterium]|nr:S26 family signal peptidase [Pirellulales bacterium]
MGKKRPDKPAKDKETAAKQPAKDGLRETIESVAIAFILAFLFRTFEAEAFVIPTGSMAPTLMGRHKDLVCKNCRFPYRVSASAEEREGQSAKREVVSSVCPQCRYEMRFGPTGPDADEPHASYRGDRIIVAKYPYEFSEPQRWDVAVFKNPNQAKQNYIKRLVGLPNETLVICKGDVFTSRDGLRGDEWRASDVNEMQRAGQLAIERKPPEKVQAMLQTVHDNNYQAPRMPARWWPDRAEDDHWTRINDDKGLEHDGQGGESWYSYRHLVPTPDDWRKLRRQRKQTTEDLEIDAELITDFYGYNTGETEPPELPPHHDHWVGDLAIECRLAIDGTKGEALLALVEGGCFFECRVDVETGMAKLSISDDPAFERTVQTGIRGPGRYRVQFANIDDQLLLWVGGKPLEFDGRFGPLTNDVPTADDLRPVRLGSNGAAMRFTDLRVRRDVYYIASRQSRDQNLPSSLSAPETWKDFVFDNAPAIGFRLDADQFLMLGDNSPQSADSRSWQGVDERGHTEHYVRRDLLIGKAVFIYWPHGVRVFSDWWFPFYPNFPRMGLVR